jgi:hypothetical protein
MQYLIALPQHKNKLESLQWKNKNGTWTEIVLQVLQHLLDLFQIYQKM